MSSILNFIHLIVLKIIWYPFELLWDLMNLMNLNEWSISEMWIQIFFREYSKALSHLTILSFLVVCFFLREGFTMHGRLLLSFQLLTCWHYKSIHTPTLLNISWIPIKSVDPFAIPDQYGPACVCLPSYWRHSYLIVIFIITELFDICFYHILVLWYWKLF